MGKGGPIREGCRAGFRGGSVYAMGPGPCLVPAPIYLGGWWSRCRALPSENSCPCLKATHQSLFHWVASSFPDHVPAAETR